MNVTFKHRDIYFRETGMYSSDVEIKDYFYKNKKYLRDFSLYYEDKDEIKEVKVKEKPYKWTIKIYTEAFNRASYSKVDALYECQTIDLEVYEFMHSEGTIYIASTSLEEATKLLQRI